MLLLRAKILTTPSLWVGHVIILETEEERRVYSPVIQERSSQNEMNGLGLSGYADAEDISNFYRQRVVEQE